MDEEQGESDKESTKSGRYYKLNDRERFYITTIAFILEISTGKFIDIIQSSVSQ